MDGKRLNCQVGVTQKSGKPLKRPTIGDAEDLKDQPILIMGGGGVLYASLLLALLMSLRVVV